MCLLSTYHNLGGYWKGFTVAEKLAKAVGVSEDATRVWMEDMFFGRYICFLCVEYCAQSLMFKSYTRFTKPPNLPPFHSTLTRIEAVQIHSQWSA